MAERKSARPNKGVDDGKKNARGRTADAPAAATDNPEARVRELSEELFRLRFQFATRQLTNTSRIRAVRREIARVKTFQRQAELAAQAAGSRGAAAGAGA